MLHPNKKHSVDFAKALQSHFFDLDDKDKLLLQGSSGESLEALFLGAKGENALYMTEMMLMAIEGNVDFRKKYFPSDPSYIDDAVKNTQAFKETLDLVRLEYAALVEKLQMSGAFYSMRSIGHMLWDSSMPGILGYFAALLYNQNNVAVEASPMTTWLEMQVGNELCKMLGFKVKPIPNPLKPPPKLPPSTKAPITGWGHITCDGSVANLEGLWMARNLKFYALSTVAAIKNEPSLAAAKNIKINLLNGDYVPLLSLDTWTLFNLPIDEVLGLPLSIENQTNGKVTTDIFSNAVTNYTIQSLGYYEMMTKYASNSNAPVAIGPITKHYSWPKGAAILGLGANNMLPIVVDLNARMDLTALEQTIQNCLANKTPIINVVVVIGTTEESAVDPLADIVKMREKYRALGLEFAIHVDAAWGGYFNTMLISNDDTDPTTFKPIDDQAIVALPLSLYVTKQYKALHKADSITIDPHKAGYVPYPAGGLCYRNSAMRNIVAFTAPVVYHGGIDPTVGVYGVEGSKPGAAASAVYFSHKVIRPNTDGYGKLLGQCMFNAKRLYAAFSIWNIDNNLPFAFIPLIPIPAIQQNLSPDKVLAQYQFIRDRIVNVSNETLINDAEAFALFKELGGDQTIITYMFNLKNANGQLNSSTKVLNNLNDAIYRKFSFSPSKPELQDTPLVVTSSSFGPGYGPNFLQPLRQRLGVTDNDPAAINFIITTIMNPWLSNNLEGSFIPNIIQIMEANIKKIIATQNLNT
jgi:glutamate/tyrosine decarboxylase-like PLP-dependent enzyme